MRRLFIANRGEIAQRISVTARRLGIEPIVPRLEGPDAVDLLNPGAVARAATAAGADAVHPGYGFLAESPDLARSVLEASLLWVGPLPSAIAALGDKAAARDAARQAGVPIADGEAPEDQTDEALARAAARIGFPVLLKPVAGGGGKGIRAVHDEAELAAALAGARREASRSFGDARLLVERFVADGRHVEAQVLADRHGHVVHLGDRDCSLQRRHQKLLEEAPAPGLAADLRAGLWAAAVRLAAAVGYEGAGTCEFLVGGDGTFVFLEMNARLQVEHPVTELVLGRDLVADQLAIADGAHLEDLGLDQPTIEARLAEGRHAIEVRLNAEDPGNGFLPAVGRVLAVRWPDGAAAFGPVRGAGLRVDAGVAAGDEVTGRFDPLLAKVIALGPDRPAALAMLGDALDGMELLGVGTNLAFLRRLVRLPVVTDGRARIDTVEADAAVVAAAGQDTSTDLPDAAWQTGARLLATSGPGWPWGGGWRGNGPSVLRLAATRGDATVERTVPLVVPLTAPPTDPLPFAVLAGDTAHVSVDGASVAFRLAAPPEVATAGRAAPRAAGDAPARDAEVRSPLPGIVVAVHVREHDDVDAGAPIATIEAMKMEHVVTAGRDGRVRDLRVQVGDRVERGRLVARLATDEERG